LGFNSCPYEPSSFKIFSRVSEGAPKSVYLNHPINGIYGWRESSGSTIYQKIDKDQERGGSIGGRTFKITSAMTSIHPSIVSFLAKVVYAAYIKKARF
jgi:hypothetical protein